MEPAVDKLFWGEFLFCESVNWIQFADLVRWLELWHPEDRVQLIHSIGSVDC